MRNWLDEYIGNTVYEVEQEHRCGGGVPLNFFKTKREAIADAEWWLKNFSKFDREKYIITVNKWKWNSKDEEYNLIDCSIYGEQEEEC